MNSPKAGAATQAYQRNARLAGQAYSTGIGAQKAQFGAIDWALDRGGETPGMREAYKVQRAGLTEGLTETQAKAYKARAEATGEATSRGNFTLGLDPTAYGAKIANALAGSRVQEGMASVEQFDKMLGYGVGASQQAGNAAVAASQNELRAISMMPDIDPRYQAALGIANAGGAIYGALNQPTQYGMYMNNGSQWYGAAPNSSGTILSSFGAS